MQTNSKVQLRLYILTKTKIYFWNIRSLPETYLFCTSTACRASPATPGLLFIQKFKFLFYRFKWNDNKRHLTIEGALHSNQ